jgi:integrase
MASLICDATSGCKTIQLNVREGDGKRPKINLGSMPKKDAQTIKSKVQAIIAGKRSQRPVDAETADWIAKLEHGLAKRLAQLGLISPRETSADQPRQTVAAFVDDYLVKRTVKAGTKRNHTQTRNYLVEYLGKDRRLDVVTRLDAEQWQDWLRSTKKLHINTVRTHIKYAKMFFGAAVKGRLIAENPFAGFKTKLVAREERMRFVTLEETDKLLDAAPNAEWRAIIALARYGGLRTPSETQLLRWDDILWDDGKIFVRSPKTEHHEGKESRWVPLFPELREILDEALQLAKPGEQYVAPRSRSGSDNLRTQMLRIIKRAGLTPWDRPFQNLRSSRQTELERHFPRQDVVKWIGNSEAVAMDHYLQSLPEDFQRATELATPRKVQNRVQQAPADCGSTSHPVPLPPETPRNSSGNLNGANRRNSLQGQGLPPRGFEPLSAD